MHTLHTLHVLMFLLRYLSNLKFETNNDFVFLLQCIVLQVSPVERVVEVREDPHEEGWVGGLEVVPDHVQDGEHDVEAVRQVEADQDLVEAVPHLRPRQELKP